MHSEVCGHKLRPHPESSRQTIDIFSTNEQERTIKSSGLKNEKQSSGHQNSDDSRSEGRAGFRACAHIWRSDENSQSGSSAQQKALPARFRISTFGRRIRSYPITDCDRIICSARYPITSCDRISSTIDAVANCDYIPTECPLSAMGVYRTWRAPGGEHPPKRSRYCDEHLCYPRVY